MPDWYVKRNGEDSPYPYSLRLGGCEYSLTEAEFGDLFAAFTAVANMVDGPYCVESEGYQDIEHFVARPDEVQELRSLLKLAPKSPLTIRRE